MSRLPPSLRHLPHDSPIVQTAFDALSRGYITPDDSRILTATTIDEIVLAIANRVSNNAAIAQTQAHLMPPYGRSPIEQAQSLEFPEGAVLNGRRISELGLAPLRSEVQEDGTIRYTILNEEQARTLQIDTTDAEEDMDTNEDIVDELFSGAKTLEITPTITPKQKRKSYLKGTATVQDMCKACYELGKDKTDEEKANINKHFEWLLHRGPILGVKVDNTPAIFFAKNQLPIYDKGELSLMLIKIAEEKKANEGKRLLARADFFKSHLMKLSESSKNKLKSKVETFKNEIHHLEDSIADINRKYNSWQTKLSQLCKDQVYVTEQLKAFNATSFAESLYADIAASPYVLYKIENGKAYFYPKEDCRIIVNNPSAGLDIDINFGRIGIVIHTTEHTVAATRLRNCLDSHGYMHPHIGTSGSVCLGNGKEIVLDAIRTGNFRKALETINDLLSQYNAGSPYHELHHFKTAERVMVDAIIPEIDYTEEEYQEYVNNCFQAFDWVYLVGPEQPELDASWRKDVPNCNNRKHLIGHLFRVVREHEDGTLELASSSSRYPKKWFKKHTIATHYIKEINADGSLGGIKFRMTHPEKEGLPDIYKDRVFEVSTIDMAYVWEYSGLKGYFYAVDDPEDGICERRCFFFAHQEILEDQDTPTTLFDNRDEI